MTFYFLLCFTELMWTICSNFVATSLTDWIGYSLSLLKKNKNNPIIIIDNHNIIHTKQSREIFSAGTKWSSGALGDIILRMCATRRIQ